jgi:hypothetical protein
MHTLSDTRGPRNYATGQTTGVRVLARGEDSLSLHTSRLVLKPVQPFKQ